MPSSFSELHDSWDPYIGLVDSSVSKGGWGISPGALENAIRLVDGDGRFNASQFTIIGCREYPWVLLHSKGTLLVSAFPVRVAPETRESRRTQVSICGDCYQIEDEAERVCDGLIHVATTLSNKLDFQLTEYEGHKPVRKKGVHRFTGVLDEEDVTVDFLGAEMARVGTARREFVPDGDETTAIPNVGQQVDDKRVVVGYDVGTQTASGEHPEAHTVLNILHASISPSRDVMRVSIEADKKILTEQINGRTL